MVTYFNRKDLVSFGSYLMSEKRKARYKELHDELVSKGINPLPVEDNLKVVHHADVENWIHELNSKL
jgi:hypothetical protein